MKSAEIIGGFLLFYCVFHLTKYFMFCGFCSAPFSFFVFNSGSNSKTSYSKRHIDSGNYKDHAKAGL